MADENLKIDLDAPGGVRMSKDPVTQMEVYMYYNKPGEYWTPLATPVPEEIAARAGYDVELFGKQREKAQKLADFMAELEADNDGNGTELMARGGYKLVEVGTLGHVKVTDDEGNSVTAVPLPRELGEDLFARLAGPEAKAKKSGVKSLDENA